MNETERMCIDRILPTEVQEGPDVLRADTRRAVAEANKMWPNGTVLKIGFLNGSSAQHARVERWARQWTDHANLEFEFTTAQDGDIRIEFANDNRSWSWVGIVACLIPPDEATMHFGWELEEGTVLHEFGHALGLGHEHQNPDGGIQWNEQAVFEYFQGYPNYWSVEMTERNVLRKYSLEQVNGTKYDKDSIMLYAYPAALTLNGVATAANQKLSAVDKQFIGSSAAYPHKGVAQDDVLVDLLVDAPDKVARDIRTAGEEDLYRFTAAEPGLYTVELEGDVELLFLRLFGPDNRTRLAEASDDSFDGLSAELSKELQPGEYLLQVRFSPWATKIGSYSMRIRRS